MCHPYSVLALSDVYSILITLATAAIALAWLGSLNRYTSANPGTGKVRGLNESKNITQLNIVYHTITINDEYTLRGIVWLFYTAEL